jgi:glycerate 2-kinase
MYFLPDQITTASLSRLTRGMDISTILAAAINAASASDAILQRVQKDSNKLIIDGKVYDLKQYKRIIVIGAGKAGAPMARAIDQILGSRINSGVVIVKEGHLDPTEDIKSCQIKLIEAGHPIPDQRNILASTEIISLISGLHADDLIICLISGGGSALLTVPSAGVSLIDLQAVNRLLLECGASINEINTIRKHVDNIKGGGLARLALPATVITLIMSDVIGDYPEIIASGPTVGDPSTFRDAIRLLTKYQIIDHIPGSIRNHLASGEAGMITETPKPGDVIFNQVNNVIIGNNRKAVQAADEAAKASGFDSIVFTTSLQGEASQVGKMLSGMAADIAISRTPSSQPICLIAGGETTVTLRGSGLGGRNQELALGSVTGLAGIDNIILATLATDGGDGPTDAAGAVVAGNTYMLGMNIGLDPVEYLSRNDAYHYFDPLGDLIKTGPTLTNVNDLVFIFAL